MLPKDYRWLASEPGPRMLVEALKEFGVMEVPGNADNPRILGWQRELQAAGLGRDYGGFYDADAIPWCGLFMAVTAHRANVERRPERNPPKLYLSALAWTAFGKAIPKSAAALGDVLVFKRSGGGHVGLYVGHDTSAFHVLGGNQSDRVTISRLSKQRLVAVRRPAYLARPVNVRPIVLGSSGSLSVNEA
ncbi:TIGR02594 family protein [Bosea minatitlanensis]